VGVSSIKHPLTPTFSLLARVRLLQLPNFANLGIMLRLLVLVNALALIVAAVKSDTLSEFTGHFLRLSVVVQPSLILAVLLLAGQRQVLGELSPAKAWAAFLTAAAVVGGAAWMLMRGMLPPPHHLELSAFTLYYLLALGAVVGYFDLRARALSPSVTEARLQALQARIRPHFLFNSMNAALSLVRSEPRRAESVIENLAELFRALMSDNRQLVRLDEEVNLCLNYLEIEQIRLGDRLKVNWKIEAMPAASMVPPLLLQPLVENAVYHGIEPADEPGEITIEIVESGRQVRIVLTNPAAAAGGGPAHFGNSGNNHGGGNRMALANIRERLQLHFDDEATLDAQVRDGLYTVVMVLPRTD
jgi:two-component system sensor histidine kinase AlgZ